MRDETSKQWWQQLGGMSQGMLFLEGSIVSAGAVEAFLPAVHERSSCDAAARRRHERAVQKLSARRVREMTALSLFR